MAVKPLLIGVLALADRSEVKDSFDRIPSIRLLGDCPWKRGLRVGRQAAMTATPNSIWAHVMVRVSTAAMHLARTSSQI